MMEEETVISISKLESSKAEGGRRLTQDARVFFQQRYGSGPETKAEVIGALVVTAGR